jgi:hypothetical protein
MARSKATFDLDADVLQATRVRAERTGKRDSDVVEEALREYLGLATIRSPSRKVSISTPR